MSAVDRAALIDAARDALVREHHELFRAAQRAVGVEPVEYDALSDRTKRLKHNQLDPLADVAVAAVLPLIADAIEAQRGAGNEFRDVVIQRCADLVRSYLEDQ